LEFGVARTLTQPARGRLGGRLPASPAVRLPRPRHARLLAAGCYLALGLLTVGWYPLSDPAHVCACVSNTDPSVYMWGLEWWPHALLHGLNPLFSYYVWTPTGANIGRSTTIPTAAFALAPVTFAFGPVVSYNVLTIASPVLAAFTAYLLCRRIAGRELPAFAGGFLFGFGAYEFAQLEVHPNLSLIFLLPVMVHLTLRRADREISARAFIAALAVVMLLQLGLSTELLVTAIIFGALALVATRFIAPPPYGSRVDDLIGEISVAGLIAVIIAAPFMYYAIIKGGAQAEWQFAETDGLDLLNPVIPTQITWIGGHTFQALSQKFIGGNVPEADGYLSLPIIAAFVLWVVTTKRRALAWVLALVAGVSLLAALGGRLHIAGVQSIELPYNWVGNLPVLKLITPARIVVYTALATAIGVAAWLAEAPAGSRRKRARWAVFLIGAALVLPNIPSRLWAGPPANPAFYRTSAYRRYLTPGESVLAMPVGWDSYVMLWQAETGFYFRMPEGYLGHYPPSNFGHGAVMNELYTGKEVEPAALADFLRATHVRAIVIDASALGTTFPFAPELERLGLRPIITAGVVLFQIPPHWLAT